MSTTEQPVAAENLHPVAKAVRVVLGLLLLGMVALNVVSPRIMSKSIGIHPIFVFFSLLIGGKIAGFWGLVLAMPVAGILNTLIEYAYDVVAGRTPKESDDLTEAS